MHLKQIFSILNYDAVKLLFISGIFLLLTMIKITDAQVASITADGSMGTQIISAESAYSIGGGTLHGNNLFHSFGRFNVLKGESAAFSGPDNIANVIGRVTGGSGSFIDGLLRSDIYGANLYLLNPSGILFGENASLDISGSFHVSTADFIRLGENGVFFADLSKKSLLTVALPESFGFLAENPSGISVQGSNLEASAGKSLSMIGGDIEINEGIILAPGGRINIASVASPGEAVPNNPVDFPDMDTASFETLGQIEISQSTIDAGGMDGGTVVIRGGRFLLKNGLVYASAKESGTGQPGAGVDAGISGDVIFDNSEMGANVFGGVNTDSGGVRVSADNVEMNASQIQSVALSESNGSSGDVVILLSEDLLLKNGSLIRTGAGGSGSSGDIITNSRNLVIKDGSVLLSNAFDGTGNGGDINVDAENVEISNLMYPGYLSGISSQSLDPGTGKAGDIVLNTGGIQIHAGSEISSPTFGAGIGGDISINCAGDIYIQGSYSLNSYQTGIFANTFGTGQGGNMELKADSLEMIENCAMQNSTLGPGNAGNAFINVGNLEIRNGSYITTSGYFGTGGSAGTLNIVSDRIYITGTGNAPYLFTGISSAAGSMGGNGGNINILAKEILTITKRRAEINSSASGPGSGGNIYIKAGKLEVLDGGLIASSAGGEGDAGDIKIESGKVYISGVHPDLFVHEFTGEITFAPAGITTQTLDKGGKAGDLSITADVIEVTDGATIDARTFGPGDGGDISLNARRITVSGENAFAREFLESEGIELNEARARVANNSSRFLLKDQATGDAGDIFLNAAEFILLDKGIINTATTTPGKAGNIFLSADRITISGDGRVLAVSAKSSYAGNAGNIFISARSSVENKNGRISSAAGTASGGNVSIKADNIWLSDGAIVSARNLETGKAGGVTLNANSGIHCDNSTITVTAEKGEGGDINISAPEVLLANEALISAETSGEGDAGNINIAARDKFWLENSTVNSEAKQADGGNILISSERMVNLWDGEITTSVGGGANTVGGNIRIDPEYVTLSNSKIIANAFEGKGGNIRIETDVYISDIGSQVEASSERGIDGVVEINALQKVITQSVKPLSDSFRSAVAILRDPCIVRISEGKYSSFVVSGRDTIPLQPGGLLPSPVHP